MFDVVNGSPRGAARPVAEVLGAIVGIVLAVSACGGGADVDGSVEARDPLRRGPQGNVAQFVVECELSHFAYDDPIVHPGMAGMSHQHQFFGNADVTADPDYQRVRGADTSCERSSDTASYWAPALLDERGEVIEPAKLTAYYRPGPGVDPATVEPYPAGLMMVAGDAFATEQQPLDVVAWGCGTGSRREPTPPDCRVRLDGGEGAGVEPATTESLRMWVTFPDCWDGRTLSTEAVSSHVSDSVDGDCPDSHPVPIPQLQMAIDFPAVDPGGLSLASGGIETGHADFWNVWDQATLEQEVRLCLNRDLVCGLSNGRGAP
jgi:hypothetical protein